MSQEILTGTWKPARIGTPALHVVPAGLSFLAACLLVLSLSYPWWGLIMYAPQYPQGLTIVSTLQETTGDVDEINGLNHYIGMMPIDQAAPLERSLAPALVWFAALSALASGFFRQKIARLMRLPLLLFPVLFLIDLQIWLWYAGNHLDPKAALSSAIAAFTPKMLGAGKIAQFSTYGWIETGWWLAVAAALLVLAADWMQLRSRKKLHGER